MSASLVVAINRALAVAEIHDAGASLGELTKIAANVLVAEYQPYWAARAEVLVLARAGGHDEARHAYEIVIGLDRDAAVRCFPQRRQSALVS